MSIDKSLKTSSALARHRNVLTRAERIAKLKDDAVWEEGTSPFGLIKVAHRKAKVGAKSKKKEEETATTAETPTSDKTAE